LSYACNSCPHAQRLETADESIPFAFLCHIIAGKFFRDTFTMSASQAASSRGTWRSIVHSHKMRSILTMYKPNFCSECGSSIERARWHFWTSRQFCADCSKHFRRAQFVAPLIAGIALFAVGLATGRAGRPAAPPLIVERGQLAPLPAPSNKTEGQRAATEIDKESGAAQKQEPAYGADGTANERPTDPEETVSLCGARTQKGTPCQRRVRGQGRCWQHKGMPAMLPPGKLIIQG
jgi:hypothetical protein